MASYFFDTSALTKRYVHEAGSNWVAKVCDDVEANLIFVSEVTEIEMISAITRRAKGGSLTTEKAHTAINDFDSDRLDQYLSVEISRAVLLSAREVVERHVLRGYDALQLASALACNREQILLNLPPIYFASADNELLAAAQSGGLQVENPNDYK